MKCPHCHETLWIAERNQIEIDYCPSCKGVWPDKGEPDKMLLYAAQTIPDDITESHRFGTLDTSHPHRQQQFDYHKQYKKKSFLNDLFDFD